MTEIYWLMILISFFGCLVYYVLLRIKGELEIIRNYIQKKQRQEYSE